MAQLPNVFNAVEASKGFEPIPEGWYEAEITKSEMKPSKTGGAFLALTFKVVDGPFNGRMVFTNLNLKHKDASVVTRAQNDLARICNACGIEEIEDSVELHGIPLGIKVIIKPGDSKWPDRNEIRGYCSPDEIPVENDDEVPY
jgi:hypothetical protein